MEADPNLARSMNSSLGNYWMKNAIPVVKDFFSDDHTDYELEGAIDAITDVLKSDIGQGKLQTHLRITALEDVS